MVAGGTGRICLRVIPIAAGIGVQVGGAVGEVIERGMEDCRNVAGNGGARKIRVFVDALVRCAGWGGAHEDGPGKALGGAAFAVQFAFLVDGEQGGFSPATSWVSTDRNCPPDTG